MRDSTKTIFLIGWVVKGDSMQIRWDVDDATSVVLNIGVFRTKVLIDGNAIPAKISMRKTNHFPFELPDGRDAVITVSPKIGTRPDITLTVNGQLMVATPKNPILCGACGKAVKPNDKFCGACGHEMPPPEHHLHKKHVNTATRVIIWLAVLFALTGGLMYYLSHEQSDLAVYLILSGIMAALAFWSRKAPLPAVLVATAIYVSLIVLSAIFDPATIGQGLLVKILFTIMLVRGIKAALALRTANA